MRASVAVLEGGEHEQLARDELIAALLRELVGDVEQRFRSLETCTSPGVPSTLGSRSSAAPSSERSRLTSAPAFISSGRTVPPWLSSSASSRCAGSMN